MKPDRLIEDLTLVPLPQWWENPWLLFSLPVLVGLIAYNLRRWWLQRKPKTLTTNVPDGPPPHEAFLARLADLRSKRGHWIAYPFAIEVSEILRGYLRPGMRSRSASRPHANFWNWRRLTHASIPPIERLFEIF